MGNRVDSANPGPLQSIAHRFLKQRCCEYIQLIKYNSYEHVNDSTIAILLLLNSYRVY